jgi:hypothetical protein
MPQLKLFFRVLVFGSLGEKEFFVGPCRSENERTKLRLRLMQKAGSCVDDDDPGMGAWLELCGPPPTKKLTGDRRRMTRAALLEKQIQDVVAQLR